MWGEMQFDLVQLNGADHSIAFDRFEDLHHILVDTILPVSHPDGRN